MTSKLAAWSLSFKMQECCFKNSMLHASLTNGGRKVPNQLRTYLKNSFEFYFPSCIPFYHAVIVNVPIFVLTVLGKATEEATCECRSLRGSYLILVSEFYLVPWDFQFPKSSLFHFILRKPQTILKRNEYGELRLWGLKWAISFRFWDKRVHRCDCFWERVAVDAPPSLFRWDEWSVSKSLKQTFCMSWLQLRAWSICCTYWQVTKREVAWGCRSKFINYLEALVWYFGYGRRSNLTNLCKSGRETSIIFHNIV